MRRLLIRPGAIGDFLVSLPAMESLRADYTEVWCAEQNVPLARFADRAGSIVTNGLDRLGLTFAEDVVERLRDFDDIVSWYGSKRPDFRALVATLGLPFRFVEALPRNCHAVEFYNRQAVELGASHPARIPRLDVPRIPRTFAAIHPFASSKNKQAPMEWFGNIAQRLDMPVRWLAGPEEHLPGAVTVSNLHELACLLAGARVFIGNDSGITHLAASVGTPVLAVFRSSDPTFWTPRGLAITSKFP